MSEERYALDELAAARYGMTTAEYIGARAALDDATIELMLASAEDPLRPLLDALDERVFPSGLMAWHVKWSVGGRDPVRAAWHASLEYDELIGVAMACFAGDEAIERTISWLVHSRGEPRRSLSVLSDELTWHELVVLRGPLAGGLAWVGLRALECDAIRAALPEPPTFGELLEIVRRW